MLAELSAEFIARSQRAASTYNDARCARKYAAAAADCCRKVGAAGAWRAVLLGLTDRSSDDARN